MPSCLGEGSPLGCTFLLVSSHGEGARELCGVSSIGTLIPFMKANTPQDLITSQRPPANTVTFGSQDFIIQKNLG